MAHIDWHSDEETVSAHYSAVIKSVVARLGYDCSITFKDVDEVKALIDQLGMAVAAYDEHQGRELLRIEDEIRSAATIREEL
ncbi:hypothetical protein [Rhodococcus sp. 14-2470-1a]|uniref:hypothetical protein n=1 Tax=Rhodococcus sp. 14-2470-1a TaxID=2023150 RepID=UPI000B9AD34F|nr:hypothetical protein [Rhodococcus sp. 14-2470-1a]OZF57024.1 hypothetical protein CH292_02030 [Rhodococcus sp. 14-2470-1a]